jgi:hypothetical protein
MQDRNLSKDSTIYNYKLLKRVRYPKLYTLPYLTLPIAAFAWGIVHKHPFVLVCSIVIVFVIHELFMKLLFKQAIVKSPKVWAFRMQFPWLGLVPNQHYSLSGFVTANAQLFFVPIIFMACAYPWIPLYTLLHIAFFHIWVLLPRIIVLAKFRKHRSIGLIKINRQDTSCYSP